jgi:hypothetical protein
VLPQAVRDAAGEPQQAAAERAWAEAAVPQQAAAVRAWVEVARQQAAAQDVREVPRRAALRRVVLPSAVPLIFRRDQVRPWPAPKPAARFGRAMPCWWIALP